MLSWFLGHYCVNLMTFLPLFGTNAIKPFVYDLCDLKSAGFSVVANRLFK